MKKILFTSLAVLGLGITAVSYTHLDVYKRQLSTLKIRLMMMLKWGLFRWQILLMVTITLLRSEEHTSELQSQRQISYAVFCLKQKSCSRKSQQYSSLPFEVKICLLYTSLPQWHILHQRHFSPRPNLHWNNRLFLIQEQPKM